MNTRPPRHFTKLATSPDVPGILRHISHYYAGSEKTLEKRGATDQYSVLNADGTPLKSGVLVVETTRGFYFGFFDHEAKRAKKK